MEQNTLVKIKNRSRATVIYNLLELGVRRELMPKETRNITFKELESLTFIPGGRALLEQDLQICDADALKELGMSVGPEYNLDEAGIKDLLVSGSQDAFLDCLDFAPEGVIDIIKNLSVTMPLNDSKKREILKNHNRTLFNVDSAIRINNESKVENAPEKKQRRVAETPAATPTRRTSVEVEDKVSAKEPTEEVKSPSKYKRV